MMTRLAMTWGGGIPAIGLVVPQEAVKGRLSFLLGVGLHDIAAVPVLQIHSADQRQFVRGLARA